MGEEVLEEQLAVVAMQLVVMGVLQGTSLLLVASHMV